MKKKVVRALLVACGILMLAGCGKKGTDGSEQGQGGSGKNGKQTESTEKAGEKLDETKWSTDSNYLYEQLNAEEKAFFDQIREQAESFYQGNEEPKKKEYGDGGVTYSFGSFDQGNLSDERANQIAEMFYFSCPKYFFTSWIVDRNDGKCSLFLWEDFGSRKALNDYRDKLEARTKEWMKSIEGITDDLEKEKAILKLICDNTEVGTMPRMQPIYRTSPFITIEGNGRGRTNAYIEGSGVDVGADIFARGLCLPSDNKMTTEEQAVIIG